MKHTENNSSFEETTDKTIVIGGDHNTVYVDQIIKMDGVNLDTFWKRLKWLLTGRTAYTIQDNGKGVFNGDFEVNK
jgi:hypothetical protein